MSGLPAREEDDDLTSLLPLLRGVVARRVRDRDAAEDVVQETLTRVLASRDRVTADSLAPYAVATARNLIASWGAQGDRARARAHLLVDGGGPPSVDEELLREEQAAVVGLALAALPVEERDLLLAHEVDGQGTASLAERRGTSAGAVAAQLHRTRARLRVEYLLAERSAVPPTERCRPVLRALSLADRRRQRELDSEGHLLSCDLCVSLAPRLLERRSPMDDGEQVRVAVVCDADIVSARQRGRIVAEGAGLSASDVTVVATAISEVARNIVRFAGRGEVKVAPVTQDGVTGVTVVARDAGPGIPDVARALEDGYSTYAGLGLGLPGCRRLMDEFTLVSESGVGTTVTMTKWR